MSSFAISPTLNKNKVFLLQKSELVDRWDPLMILYQRENQSFKYETKKLKNLIISNPEYGAGEIGIERKTETEPRYIRITDIDEYGLLSSDVGVTAKTIDKKYVLEDNDFLFARSGATVGKAYLHKKDLVPYPCFYAGYMIRYRLNEKEVLPEYLFAFTQTSFYKEWVKVIQRPTGQPNINAEEFKSLSFPLPPKEIQKKIVNIFSKAYGQKKQNEAQAEKLLAGIDNYLLKELGITLPAPPKNNLKNRIFKTSTKEISGNRFDPFFHQKYFAEVERAIKKSKYSTDILQHQLSFIESGSRPQGGVSNIDEGILSFGGEHVNNLCEVEIKTPKYIPIEFHRQNLATETKLKDILIVKDGATTGKIGIINKPEYSGQNINEHVFLLRPTNKIDVVYLVNYLNFSALQILLKKNITGATVTGITKDALKALPVVLPPPDKQKDIAKHISAIRKQAQQLKDKTKSVLEQANKEIEQILLGR